MSIPLLVAAVLSIVLGVAHSYLGERYILVRLFKRGDLPKLYGDAEFTRVTLRFAWHLTTLAWMGFAGVLVVQASSAASQWRGQGRVIAATFGASGVLALVASRGRHLSWVLFFLIGGLVWLGVR